MDRRAARRLAKWVGAGYIRACLEAGAEIETHTDGDPDSRDTRLLIEEMAALVARLEREGHE